LRAATPAGIDSWRKPAVLLNTSILKGTAGCCMARDGADDPSDMYINFIMVVTSDALQLLSKMSEYMYYITDYILSKSYT
jgi:hypothetical protein